MYGAQNLYHQNIVREANQTNVRYNIKLNFFFKLKCIVYQRESKYRCKLTLLIEWTFSYTLIGICFIFFYLEFLCSKLRTICNLFQLQSIFLWNVLQDVNNQVCFSTVWIQCRNTLITFLFINWILISSTYCYLNNC